MSHKIINNIYKLFFIILFLSSKISCKHTSVQMQIGTNLPNTPYGNTEGLSNTEGVGNREGLSNIVHLNLAIFCFNLNLRRFTFELIKIPSSQCNHFEKRLWLTIIL